MNLTTGKWLALSVGLILGQPLAASSATAPAVSAVYPGFPIQRVIIRNATLPSASRQQTQAATYWYRCLNVMHPPGHAIAEPGQDQTNRLPATLEQIENLSARNSAFSLSARPDLSLSTGVGVDTIGAKRVADQQQRIQSGFLDECYRFQNVEDTRFSIVRFSAETQQLARDWDIKGNMLDNDQNVQDADGISLTLAGELANSGLVQMVGDMLRLTARLIINAERISGDSVTSPASDAANSASMPESQNLSVTGDERSPTSGDSSVSPEMTGNERQGMAGDKFNAKKNKKYD